MTVLMIEERMVMLMIAGNLFFFSFLFIFFPSLYSKTMMIEVTMRRKDE